jgi:regulator of replication initiation timing
MSAKTMTPELQQAQDMLNMLTQQRNAAQNAIVEMGARLQAMVRENAQLMAELGDLKARPGPEEDAQSVARSAQAQR